VQYDVVVIGGGITGAGILRDLALRGIPALLLEKNRPGGATTASSTHLIHGGLRYLLYDRLTTHTTCWDSGHIVRTARPLLTRLPILWPVYRDHRHGLETVETLLESYDSFQKMKEGKPHLRFSPEETLRLFPLLRKEGLRGSVIFDEWWVDPVALVNANLESAKRAGGEFRTGQAATDFLREGGAVKGVRVRSSARTEDIPARLVINAAGPWVDRVARWAQVDVPLRLRKGTHLLYNRPLGLSARPLGLLLEAEDRERYVFVIPGPDGATRVGPTDVEAPEGPEALRASPEEISYLLASVRRYFPDFPEAHDGATVGARPILGQAGPEKRLSREFEVYDHAARDGVPGLLTVAGGKMSDYRLMAEAAGDAAATLLGKLGGIRSHLTTLDGAPVDNIPNDRPPSARFKGFLRRHSRFREAYAWAYLAGGYARHIFRRLRAPAPATAAEVSSYFSKSA